MILPSAEEGNEHIWNQFTLRVLNGKRDALKEALIDEGIGCEIYYPVPMHQQQCFAHLASKARANFQVTEQLADEVLSIPVYPELTRDQQNVVVSAIQKFFQ